MKPCELLRRIVEKRRGVKPVPLTLASASACEHERSWYPLMCLRRGVVVADESDTRLCHVTLTCMATRTRPPIFAMPPAPAPFGC